MTFGAQSKLSVSKIEWINECNPLETKFLKHMFSVEGHMNKCKRLAKEDSNFKTYFQ